MPFTSKIANQLLVTPFDNKCAVNQSVSEILTEKEFCENCYSHPLFEKQPQFGKEALRDDYNDFPTTYEDIKSQIKQQKNEYDFFDEWRGNFLNGIIYTVNGNAGTGKTTFINRMRYCEKKKNVKWIIMDIQTAKSYVEWISDIRTDISNFDSAEAKVYGSVMNNLWELVFHKLDKDGNFSLKNVDYTLNEMVKKYKECFWLKNPSGRKLLDEVCKIVDNRQYNMKKRVELVAQVFQKYVNGQVYGRNGSIIVLLNIYVLCLRCLSDNLEDKYIIVFDNFERFIAKDEIYNKDVEHIRSILGDFMNTINIQGNIHKGFFKMIMVVRDSTARMCGVRLQASDANANNLDLGNWYDSGDIIRVKKKWYNDNGISVVNSDLFEQIISDLRICSDGSVTGLKLFIEPLFNNNKRLITDFIGMMIESQFNEKNIIFYQKLWKEDTSQSRFAARSIIRGMILYELEKKPDKLFEHLKTYTRNANTNGVGDARKILTILYNNIVLGNENEMPLQNLLGELLQGMDVVEFWNGDQFREKRNSISEILFYMNSYNRRENDWLQFIDFQYKHGNQDIVDDIIAEDPKKLEQIIREHMRDCTVHLMPGGRVYLINIAASFEFFSLRYVPNYSPLFTLIPTPEEIVQCSNVKHLACYKKINGVKKYAMDCIGILRNGEDCIRLRIGNDANGYYHYTRIINQHKSYIEKFETYIRDKYCVNNLLDKAIRDKYVDLCDEIYKIRSEYSSLQTKMIARG